MCLKSVLRNHRGFVTQGVTQSNFTQTKSVVSVTQKHITTLLIKLCDKAKTKSSECGAVGSALPWIVEPASSSLVTQTKIV